MLPNSPLISWMILFKDINIPSLWPKIPQNTQAISQFGILKQKYKNSFPWEQFNYNSNSREGRLLLSPSRFDHKYISAASKASNQGKKSWFLPQIWCFKSYKLREIDHLKLMTINPHESDVLKLQKELFPQISFQSSKRTNLSILLHQPTAWNLTKTTNLTEDPSLNLMSHRIRERNKEEINSRDHAESRPKFLKHTRISSSNSSENDASQCRMKDFKRLWSFCERLDSNRSQFLSEMNFLWKTRSEHGIFSSRKVWWQREEKV